MSIIHKESALVGPVCGHLRRRGFGRQQQELQFFEYSIDLYGYGCRDHATTAVELKLTRWMRAFEQSLIYQLCADFVYLAMPVAAALRVDKPLLVRYGVGLIGVQPNLRCGLLLDARQSAVVMPRYRDFYVDLLQERSE